MKIEYIDIHSHLTHEDYEDDLEFVLQRMKENNVATITIGTDLEDSKKAIKLAEENENIFAVIGFHPIDTKHSSLDEFDEMEKLIQHPKCVGIGECGLDYFRSEDALNKDKQKIFFEKQIELTIKYGKPLMIHCREAWEDTLQILESFCHPAPEGPLGGPVMRDPDLKVNFHFFNGTPELAKRILDLGFQVSFTGIITFVSELEETVKSVPLDKMMSETDAPFASPKPYRGSRNEPTYVIEVVKEIAKLKGLDLEVVKKQLIKNAEEFWGIEFLL